MPLSTPRLPPAGGGIALSLELLLARLPGLRLAAGPMPQSQAVLRGVRRLPVAFDALPGRPSAEECVARIAARLERFEVGGFIDVAGQAFTSHDRGGECHALGFREAGREAAGP